MKNIIYYNTETFQIIAIVQADVIPELTEGMAASDKYFPQIDAGRGKEVRCFYNKATDEITHEIHDRPLTQEEMSQVILENQELMKKAIDDLALGGM